MFRRRRHRSPVDAAGAWAPAGPRSSNSAVRALCVLLPVLCGCTLFEEQADKDYRTIEADPRHDTKTAEKEHEKALAIMSRHFACFHNVPADEVQYVDYVVHCELNCSPKDLVTAEEHLQKALVADVTYGPAHNTLGMLYFHQRRYYLAAWEYEYAAKLMPERVEPLYNLALLLESADKLDDAISQYELARGLEPHNPHIIGNLVRARMRNGETVDGLRDLLEQLVFHDSRPDWITWARDQLGLSPIEIVEVDGESPPHDSSPPPSIPQVIPPLPAAPLLPTASEPAGRLRIGDLKEPSAGEPNFAEPLGSLLPILDTATQPPFGRSPLVLQPTVK